MAYQGPTFFHYCFLQIATDSENVKLKEECYPNEPSFTMSEANMSAEHPAGEVIQGEFSSLYNRGILMLSNYRTSSESISLESTPSYNEVRLGTDKIQCSMCEAQYDNMT